MTLVEELRMRYHDGCGFQPGDLLYPRNKNTQYRYMIVPPVIVISQNPTMPYQYYVGAKYDPNIEKDKFTEFGIDGFEWQKEENNETPTTT